MKQHRLVWTAAATLSVLYVVAATSATHLLSPTARHHSLAFSPGRVSPSSHRYPGNTKNQCHRRPRPLTSSASVLLLSCPKYDHGLFAIKDNSNDDGDEISAENNSMETSRDENDTPNNENTINKQQVSVDAQRQALPPPRFLALGYNMAAFLNIIAALILIWNINSVNIVAITPTTTAATTTNLLASTRHQPNILATYTAGSLGYLLLAGGSCNILSKSAKANRLQTSNTYKRLTMGTLLFGLVGLFSLPGEAGCILGSSSNSPSSTPIIFGAAFAMTQLAKFSTAFVSFVGWEYSVGGFGSSSLQRVKNILREILSGCQSLCKTYPVTEERPATFYRTFFIFATLGNLIFNIPELAFNLKQGGVGGGIIGALFSLPVSLTISSMARLGLLSFVLYVLKDAAERKRLEGTTFVKLNMMVGIWAIGVGIAQGLIDGPSSPFNVRRAADKVLFGLLFLNNGVLSQLTKMGIIKPRDEENDDPDADPPLRVVF